MAVGMQFLTTVEARTHFGLWSIMASLLIEGSDIRKIATDRLEILLNHEVIAVNQDSLGEQGRVVWSRYTKTDSTGVISKRMQDSSRAVMLFNRNGPTKSITVKLSDIGLAGKVSVRDLWSHSNLPDATDSITIAGIPHHGCAMLRIRKVSLADSRLNQPMHSLGKNSTAQLLFNTQIGWGIRLSPKYSEIRIFDLEGGLLFKMQLKSTGSERLIQLPTSLSDVGMVIVKFLP